MLFRQLRASVALRAAAASLVFACATAAPATTARADLPPPAIDQRVAATFVAGDLTLTGHDLGVAPATRSVVFHYGSATATIAATSPAVRT